MSKRTVPDLKELFKQASEIAQQVPESMQEAAFNRALDLLTGDSTADNDVGKKDRKVKRKKSSATKKSRAKKGEKKKKEATNTGKGEKAATNKTGPKVAINSLIDSGYFSVARTGPELKAYLKKAETIVRYLGRYTHKIALSDSRIKDINATHVTFNYHDYRDSKDKCMPLQGEEFIRRFLLHVLPEGFMRIRHYGFLANRTRKQKHAIIKSCLQTPHPATTGEAPTTEQPRLAISSLCPCPKCHRGHLRVVFEIPAKPLHGR